MYELIIDKSKLDLYKTLNSGQVFRYFILEEDKKFILMTGNHYVVVNEFQEGYSFECDADVFKEVWYPYLDLARDYEEVNRRIISKDSRLEEAIELHQGIRILKQDPFEMLITFIVSQSKAIPQIKKLVDDLSSMYGSKLADYEEISIYAFPRPQELAQITEEGFREMKFGYRAPYLEAGVAMFLHCNEDLSLLDDSKLKKSLISIKGVGDKVASCVMLFGYGRHSSFPIDVWMRRIVMKLYFPKSKTKISDKKLEAFGKDLYGLDAGIAQQYLFEYGRTALKS